MKIISIFTFAGIIIAGGAFFAYSAGPSDEFAKNAFKQILSQADTNKDGKLSSAECRGIYKDAAIAEKNCTYWDADKDGIITEDEYVGKAMSIGRKK
jgi:hypothetical protein